MANEEMYTRRDGKQIAIPSLVIPKDALTSIMALRERYETKGKSYSLTALVLDCLVKGCDANNRSMDYAEKTKEARDEMERKNRVKNQVRRDLVEGRKVDPLAVLAALGISLPQVAVEESESEAEILDGDELTEEQLEQATSPTGSN